MKGFLLAALPWIVIGISLALVFENYSKNRKNKTSHADEDQKQPAGNYMTEGVCFGMCTGVVSQSESTSANHLYYKRKVKAV